MPFDPGVRRFAQSAVKFFDQPSCSQPGFANNQSQLSLALPRPLPAPHQHGNFLVATNERRQLTLADTTAAATGTNQSVQRHRFGHAFEWLTSTVLDDEQTSNLTLH